MSRNKAQIDWDIAGKLLEAGCLGTEVAAYFGVCKDSMYRICLRDLKIAFSLFSQQKRAKGESSLRAKQYQVAMTGDKTMLVWLGKQRLGQKDVISETHRFDGKLSEFLDFIKGVKNKGDFKKIEVEKLEDKS